MLVIGGDYLYFCDFLYDDNSDKGVENVDLFSR